MTLSTDQQTALEQPVVRLVYFAEFHFLSGIVYVCSLNQTISWGGYDWIGLGQISSISAIEEKAGTSSAALNFQLNIAQAEWLSLAAGAVEEYRGRDAKLYACPLNTGFGLIDTPQICWRGTMDTMSPGITGKQGEATGVINLKCETSAHGLKRKSSLRLNAAQQKQRHPSDTGFDYLVDLLSAPAPWLSKRFQQI